jgi:hypothetical protein
MKISYDFLHNIEGYLHKGTQEHYADQHIVNGSENVTFTVAALCT